MQRIRQAREGREWIRMDGNKGYFQMGIRQDSVSRNRRSVEIHRQMPVQEREQPHFT